MFGFPVPVSNQSIPRGWFAALVRFMNSLLLRGDGRYFAVTHTTEGTTIKPTPALIQALERSGGAAPAAGGGGATYGIEATIDGSTASVALVEGGTASSISLIPTAPVTLTAGSNGELIIGSTASGGGIGAPNYADPSPVPVVPFNISTASYAGWIIGDVRLFDAATELGNAVFIDIGPLEFDVLEVWTDDPSFVASTPICFPVPSGTTYNVVTSGSTAGFIFNLSFYRAL